MTIKSPYFTYRELTQSPTADEKQIANIPGPNDLNNLQRLVSFVLDPLREKFGPIRINSGYRSALLNTAVGGSTTSYHTTGCAADIEPVSSDVSNLDLVRYIMAKLPVTEVIAEFWAQGDPHAGWVHVAFDPFSTKRQLKLKDATHNYTPITVAELEKLYG